jgi:GT2 family glycosyltransferase
MPAMAAPEITIVIPAYNEAEAIVSVVNEAREVFDQAFTSFEIVVIDDGSADDTAGALGPLAAAGCAHPRHSPSQPLRQKRGFAHRHAASAGDLGRDDGWRWPG